MFRTKSFLTLLFICLFTLPLVVHGQNPSRVYIVVVDDFGGNMATVVEAVLAAPVYQDVLLPLATAADQLGSELIGDTIITPDVMLEGGFEQLQQGVGALDGGGLVGGVGGERLAGDAAAQSESVVQEEGLSLGTPIVPQYEPLPIDGLTEGVREASLQINELLQSEALVYGTGEEEVSVENCAINPEGEGVFATGGAGVFATGGASVFATGGASVFATGGAGVFATGGAGFANATHGERVVRLLQELQFYFAPDADIVIEEVDTAGFTTSILLERIQQKIEEIAASDPGAPIVINMSFAIVPCQTVGTLAAYDALMRQFDPNIAGDMAALQTFFADLIASGVYSNPLNGSDTLLGFFGEVCDPERRCQYADAGTIIAVAAAGNAGETFPYYPAAFSGVVSVSASDDNGAFVPINPLATYSNYGGVMMPGIWVNAAGIDIGTSFAAPRYSFLMALYLLGLDNDFCLTGSPVTPALPNDWSVSPPNLPFGPNDSIC
jgi:NAD(P)-dependent dehydrogenase (short-subunit alcohol dehydrogenase family)